MIFESPLKGIIHPQGWTRPAGNTDFVVRQAFGCTGFVRERAFGSCPHFHRGLDLINNVNNGCGADVLAPAPGHVRTSMKVVSTNATNGENIIVLDHGGGWFTGYGHLSARSVAKGQPVKTGQKIGNVGTTGNSTGCHLHWFVKSVADTAKSLYLDGNGRWEDPWPRLIQNVTLRPKGPGINIRTAPSTTGSPFAHTEGVAIIRLTDKSDLGLISDQRRWGGTVDGDPYTLPGEAPAHAWERIWLDNDWRFIARPLAIRSAT